MTGLQQLCSLVANRPNKRAQYERTGEYIVYYRVSTKRQEESKLGLLAQRKAAEAFVSQQEGRIVAEYQETETGKNSKRPEILKAILHAHRSCATLVIAKIDRLARNVWFTSTLMESGVDFVACDNPHATRLTIHILAAVAEEEARLTSERTKAALAAYKARGGILGPESFHKLPADWDVKRAAAQQKATEANAEKARAAYELVLPVMQELRAQGQTYEAIAQELNHQCYKTRTRKAWNRSQVKRVLDRA